eukprot:TRINITY_DN882_c0_g1_i6.p1 TRINITY_DN882_c0_g1~~TRINITY_DN882_c0_g1_i6.p1  ORF type:complete len:1056 (+),score=359.06 TRINITY_DN882_c0_g1_i6:62-3169(+)
MQTGDYERRLRDLEAENADKNAEISALREQVADMNFDKSMRPVQEMLTQTPYSAKVLLASQQLPVASQMSDGDVAMSQELSGAPEDALEGPPSACSAETLHLEDLARHIAEIQRKINSRMCQTRSLESSWGATTVGNPSSSAAEERAEAAEAKVRSLEEQNQTLSAKLQTVLRQWNKLPPAAPAPAPEAAAAAGAPPPPPPSHAASDSESGHDGAAGKWCPPLQDMLRTLKELTIHFRELEEMRARAGDGDAAPRGRGRSDSQQRELSEARRTLGTLGAAAPPLSGLEQAKGLRTLRELAALVGALESGRRECEALQERVHAEKEASAALTDENRRLKNELSEHQAAFDTARQGFETARADADALRQELERAEEKNMHNISALAALGAAPLSPPSAVPEGPDDRAPAAPVQQASQSADVQHLEKQLSQQREAARAAEAQLHERLEEAKAAALREAARAAELESANEALAEAHKAAERRCADAQHEAAARGAQTAQLEDRLRLAQEEVARVATAAEAGARAAAQEVEAQREAVAKDAAAHREAVAAVEAKVAQLRSELAATHEAHQEQLTAVNEDVKALNDKLADAEGRAQQAAHELAEAQKVRAILRNEAQAAQTDLDALSRGMEEKRTELCDALRERDEARSRCEVNATTLRDLQTRTQSLVEASHHEVNVRKTLEAENERLIVEHREMAERQNAHEAESSVLNAKLTDSERRAAQYSKEVEEHCAQLVVLKQALQRLNVDKEAEEEALKQAQKKVRALETAVAGLEEAKAALVKEKAEERAKVAQAESENMALRLQVIRTPQKESDGSPTTKRKATEAVEDAAAANSPGDKRRKVATPMSASVVAPATRARNTTGPQVILSGFKPQHQDDKKAVVETVTALGGRVLRTGMDVFDASCTHVIIPNTDSRTVKTVAAVLSGNWVMTMHWVRASRAAGQWADEAPYGYCLPHEGLKGRAVCLTSGFRQARPESVKNAAALVGYGGGSVVEDVDAADVVICDHAEGKKAYGGRAFCGVWEGFIEWIFPTNWAPPCSL